MGRGKLAFRSRPWLTDPLCIPSLSRIPKRRNHDKIFSIYKYQFVLLPLAHQSLGFSPIFWMQQSPTIWHCGLPVQMHWLHTMQPSVHSRNQERRYSSLSLHHILRPSPSLLGHQHHAIVSWDIIITTPTFSTISLQQPQFQLHQIHQQPPLRLSTSPYLSPHPNSRLT